MIRVSCKEESYLYNAYHMVKAFFPEEEVVSLAEEKASHFARADFPDGSSLVLDACETGEDPGSRRETDRRWYRMLSKKAGPVLGDLTGRKADQAGHAETHGGLGSRGVSGLVSERISGQ